MKPLVIAVVLAVATGTFAQSGTEPRAVGKQIDIAEIDRTLKAIDVDRTSGKDGERQSAAYLERKLTEYGIEHTRHDMKAYLSWPKRAALVVNSAAPTTFRAVTPAFSASTGQSGVTGDLFFLPPRRKDALLHTQLQKVLQVVGCGIIAPGLPLHHRASGDT